MYVQDRGQGGGGERGTGTLENHGNSGKIKKIWADISEIC